MADADALRDAGLTGVPATPEPAPPPTAAPGDETVMTLVDHLDELRKRLFRVILAVVAGGVIGLLLRDDRPQLPARPAARTGRPQTLGPGDAFAIQLRISLVIGVILAMPVILYQVWAFIAPGLTPSERKTVRPWVPLALVFFALGVAVAYLVLPYALQFLFSFNDEQLVGTSRPAVLRLRDDDVPRLRAHHGIPDPARRPVAGRHRRRRSGFAVARRYVILAIAIFSAVATPGGDLVSPFVLGGTMYLLFELTVLFIKRTGR